MYKNNNNDKKQEFVHSYVSRVDGQLAADWKKYNFAVNCAIYKMRSKTKIPFCINREIIWCNNTIGFFVFYSMSNLDVVNCI